MSLPKTYKTKEVAEHFSCSVEWLSKFARKNGTCRIIGKRVAFTDNNIDALMEAMRPAPTLSEHATRSGGFEAALARRQNKEQAERERASKSGPRTRRPMRTK
ncbi:MAG: hypothetical protein AAF412_09630 [Pseudomonadota bacterium]